MKVDLQNKKGEIIYSCEVINVDRAVAQALSFAILYHIELPGLMVENEILDDLNFSGMNLEGAQFKHCSLKRTTFSNVKADALWFVNCEMNHCLIEDSTGKLRDLTFCDVVLKKAKLKDLQYCEIHLAGCDCSKTDFENCNLQNLFAIDSLFKEATFSNCSLRSAIFSGGVKYGNPVESASFIDCDLYQTDFRDYDLSSLHFRNSNIQDANTIHEFLYFGFQKSGITVAIDCNMIWFNDFQGSIEEFEKEFKEDPEGFTSCEFRSEQVIEELLPFLRRLIKD